MDVVIKRKLLQRAYKEQCGYGKSRVSENRGYSLWCTREEKYRKGLGIMVHKQLKEIVLEIYRVGDRVIRKFILGKQILNFITITHPKYD